MEKRNDPCLHPVFTMEKRNDPCFHPIFTCAHTPHDGPFSSFPKRLQLIRRREKQEVGKAGGGGRSRNRG
jgi:hypothetical protein